MAGLAANYAAQPHFLSRRNRRCLPGKQKRTMDTAYSGHGRNTCSHSCTVGVFVITCTPGMVLIFRIASRSYTGWPPCPCHRENTQKFQRWGGNTARAVRWAVCTVHVSLSVATPPPPPRAQESPVGHSRCFHSTKTWCNQTHHFRADRCRVPPLQDQLHTCKSLVAGLEGRTVGDRCELREGTGAVRSIGGASRMSS